jgi:hypothetical protein
MGRRPGNGRVQRWDARKDGAACADGAPGAATGQLPSTLAARSVIFARAAAARAPPWMIEVRERRLEMRSERRAAERLAASSVRDTTDREGVVRMGRPVGV